MPSTGPSIDGFIFQFDFNTIRAASLMLSRGHREALDFNDLSIHKLTRRMFISSMHIIQPVSFLIAGLIRFCVADPDDDLRTGILIKRNIDVYG